MKFCQIDAHVGNVFTRINKQLCIINCGEDKTIKVWVVWHFPSLRWIRLWPAIANIIVICLQIWDVATGDKLYTFETPVVCGDIHVLILVMTTILRGLCSLSYILRLMLRVERTLAFNICVRIRIVYDLKGKAVCQQFQQVRMVLRYWKMTKVFNRYIHLRIMEFLPLGCLLELLGR